VYVVQDFVGKVFLIGSCLVFRLSFEEVFVSTIGPIGHLCGNKIDYSRL
jgi:hypothetical protein